VVEIAAVGCACGCCCMVLVAAAAARGGRPPGVGLRGWLVRKADSDLPSAIAEAYFAASSALKPHGSAEWVPLESATGFEHAHVGHMWTAVFQGVCLH